MTDIAPQTTPFVPQGQPVRRFVMGLVALVVVFAIAWWTALAAPRLGGGVAETTYEEETGRGAMVVRLENQGPFAVQVQDVSVRDDTLRTGPPRVEGQANNQRKIELRAGETVRLAVDFTCGASGFGRRSVQVTVRTAIGIERTRQVDSVDVPRSCLDQRAPVLPPPRIP